MNERKKERADKKIRSKLPGRDQLVLYIFLMFSIQRFWKIPYNPFRNNKKKSLKLKTHVFFNFYYYFNLGLSIPNWNHRSKCCETLNENIPTF